MKTKIIEPYLIPKDRYKKNIVSQGVNDTYEIVKSKPSTEFKCLYCGTSKLNNYDRPHFKNSQNKYGNIWRSVNLLVDTYPNEKFIKVWAWCWKHEKEVKSAIPHKIHVMHEVTYYNTRNKPVYTHNEVILGLSGDNKHNIYKGPFARQWYASLYRPKNYDLCPEFERLQKVMPGKKFLIYTLDYKFITETRKREQAEDYLKKDRVLVYRGES
jgi:hypothetical protein